jgi:hypothetical protein
MDRLILFQAMVIFGFILMALTLPFNKQLGDWVMALLFAGVALFVGGLLSLFLFGGKKWKDYINSLWPG